MSRGDFMDNALLTREEMIMLNACETIIARGQREFFRTGMALMAIRDKRLYRAFDQTFEDYCRRRWNFGREYGYRLLAAVGVQKNLLPTGQQLPNERQARVLGELPAEAQAPAYRLATESFAQVTGKPVEEMPSNWVRATVDVTKEIISTGGSVSDDDGGMLAATAAITIEAAERIQRRYSILTDRAPALLNGDFVDIEAAVSAIRDIQVAGPYKVLVYKRQESK